MRIKVVPKPGPQPDDAAVPVRRRPPFLILAVLLVAAAAAAYFLLGNKDGERAPVATSAVDRAPLVSTVKVARRSFTRMAPVSGEARPRDDVRVFAPASGVRIAEVLVEIGDIVEAEAPLARLDADVVDAQIREAEAGVRQAASEQARAASEWARVDPVKDDPAFSKEEIERWRAAAAAADAQLAARKAALSELKARTQGGFVRAPVGGLVIERNARVGEFADQKALFRIVGGNALEVAAFVSEGDILSLRQGQIANFTATDGAVVRASLRVAPVAVDPQTRTGLALFDLPADAPVRAGMYLKGEVVIGESEAFAVPLSAITYAAGEPGVFVIKDGRAALTKVTLGARAGDHVAVTSGLKGDEIVAAAGGAFLMDGDIVRTTDAAATGGATTGRQGAGSGG
ncbi:MAG: efflux RND transporter periplasmic adaptor subunit [Parvularculaceae bacterium]|nr:efflux RND transporter periplasmic adaptor subunit [Parvularculaceae bacterium]